MSTLYIETSAVLAWLLGEPVSHRVIDTINRHETIVSSVSLIVETGRALIRAETEGIIDAGGHQRLKGLFAEHSNGWSYLEINSLIRKRAAKPFPIEPIRSLDAVHLSTALEFLQIYPDLVVLSFDKRIIDNLVPLGLNCA
ncbi:MAG: type II toxin-antitoxin system VapC family toxin [Spirochaetes bacterium]|nr:type II toxin-antitoxin system VapC family toxin [Spirochaetota bacterium]